MQDRYNVKECEARWQKAWEDAKSFIVTEDSRKK